MRPVDRDPLSLTAPAHRQPVQRRPDVSGWQPELRLAPLAEAPQTREPAGLGRFARQIEAAVLRDLAAGGR